MTRHYKYGVNTSDPEITRIRKEYDKRFGSSSDTWGAVIENRRAFQSEISPLLDHLDDFGVFMVINNNRRHSSVQDAKKRRENAGSAQKRRSTAKNIRLVDMGDLNIDDDYQRILRDESRIKKMAGEWDYYGLCRPLLVGKREDGTLWIIDGQHRYYAAIDAGMTEIDCEIVESSGKQFEAKLFHECNTRVKKPNVFDRFHSSLCYGDKVATELLEVAMEFGIRIPRSPISHWPNIACLAKVWSIYKTAGRDAFSRTLAIIVAVYDSAQGRKDALRDYCLPPIFYLISRRPELDDARLERLLMRHDIHKIVSRGDADYKMRQLLQTGSRHAAIANIILQLYNKRLSQKKKLKPLFSEATGVDEPA